MACVCLYMFGRSCFLYVKYDLFIFLIFMAAELIPSFIPSFWFVFGGGGEVSPAAIKSFTV